MLQVARYARKPFIVEAVQVTDENMIEVAAWCKGEIKQAPDGTRYIKVDVTKPQNERQTMAFANNWVLLAETGYKVFTNKPFHNSYQEFFEPACGDPSRTANHQPCVLGKGHRRSWPPVGCRSLQDYVVLAPLASPNEFIDPNVEVSS